MIKLDFFTKYRRRAVDGPMDRTLLGAVLFLLGFGLLIIASAGVAYGKTRFDDPYFFFKEQLLGLVVGLVLMAITAAIDYHRLRRFVLPIFITALTFLILIFIPGFGTTIYGAARWVDLGPLSFQPSEVMKLAIILYLAAWFSKREKKLNADTFEGLFPFLAVVGLVSFLIYKQPDAGTLGLIFLIALAMFFASGARLVHIFGLIAAGALGLLFLIKVAPYRLQRFLVFLDPGRDPLGYGYQINQALYALGSGGIFGVGLGQSRQKFNYLPEPVTDSIFAILGEELGFIGTTLLVVAFLLIAWRGMRIARHAPDEFGRLIAIGVVSWIFLQAFINMAAISGTIPLTGVPLPFVSYGGTSLAVLLAAVGLLLNISKQARLKAQNK